MTELFKIFNLLPNALKTTKTPPGNMSKHRFMLFAWFAVNYLILSFIILPLHAQEGMFFSGEGVITPSRQQIEMEIRTSTLPELALWCRTLGLPESGTRADLSNRLRDYFDLPHPVQNTDVRRVVTIESAQTTEYFTISVIDEDYARLTGSVTLSLKEDNVTHRISANEILYNRTRNILTARGQVLYERIDVDKTEIFRGENITVNLDNWSSIFIDGSYTLEIDKDNTAYLFSGAVISRGNENITILSDASISNASNEEALWSITASKLWLLPGSDFAIFNAVLRVGVIPVLYIPFFYYPGEKLFFHPVIGYRNREGGYVQTTTYILGQPRSTSSETSSITRILGNTDDMEKERHGLFLRSTGNRVSDPSSISLKALIDYYINLGVYLGIELSLPKSGILNPLELSFGLGFTRTISMIGGNYTPYKLGEDGLYDGSSDWNHSNLFSGTVPFRYRMRLNSSITFPNGSLSWNFPFYSDPFVDRDFLNRSESMDLVNVLQQGAAVGDSSSSQNEIRTYQWHVNTNYSPSFPSLSPYISRVSFSNISTTLSFKTIRDEDIFYNNSYSPGRFFYAPDRYTIFNFSGVVSGNLYSYGSASTRPASSTNQIQETENPLDGIGNPISPWAQNENTSGTDAENQVNDNSNPAGFSPFEILSPPVLNTTFSLPRTGSTVINIDYQVSPSTFSELQFMSDKWESYDQVDWSETQSVLTSIGQNSSINLRLDHTTGLYANTVTFSSSGTIRDIYLNEEAFRTSDGQINTTRMDEIRRQQYNQTNYSTSYAYNGTFRPFMDNQIFSQTNFQYNFRGILVRSKRYTGTERYELSPIWGSWVKDERREGIDIPGLNSHRLSANISADIMGNQQALSISTDMPPLDGLIITNATFRYKFSETNINFRVERPLPPAGEDEWIFRPIYITERLRLEDIGSFTFNMVIKPEEDYDVTNLSASLSLWNFRTAYIAEKSPEYIFEQSTGWVQQGDPYLRSKELSFFYNDSFSFNNLFDRRISLSMNINTSISYDLQRYTNSNFQFTLSLNLNIPGFLEFRFSSTSQNVVIWRYFKNIPGMEDYTFMYPEGPQNNLFVDLFDSFNFFDDAKRRRSGFKIQRLNMTAIHFLGDWQAELGVSMYPYQDSSLQNQVFRIASDVTFLIQWKPISEIRTNIGYDGRNERWARR